jgi:hypothetical protein
MIYHLPANMRLSRSRPSRKLLDFCLGDCFRVELLFRLGTYEVEKMVPQSSPRGPVVCLISSDPSDPHRDVRVRRRPCKAANKTPAVPTARSTLHRHPQRGVAYAHSAKSQAIYGSVHPAPTPARPDYPDVAVQVQFVKATFETSFSLDRFEGRNQALSRYGSTEFNLYTPRRELAWPPAGCIKTKN